MASASLPHPQPSASCRWGLTGLIALWEPQHAAGTSCYFVFPTQESAAFRCTALLSLLSIALELSLLMRKLVDAQIKRAQDRGLALGLQGLAFRSGAKAATAWCRELNCTN